VDAGETAAEAAAREAFEEVALPFAPDALEELFEVRTQAHGEPEGRKVHMRVFRGWTDDDPVPSGEVGSVHWTTSADADHCPPAGVEVLRRLVDLGLID
jgi:8-oxo-dGTP pyrophosphatase MutT (NUDIX family)